jgi:hypothetical protein
MRKKLNESDLKFEEKITKKLKSMNECKKKKEKNKKIKNIMKLILMKERKMDEIIGKKIYGKKKVVKSCIGNWE